MGCLDEEKFQLYLDGELEEAERAEASRHLEECPACRSYLEFLREEEEDLRLAFAPVEIPLQAFARIRGDVLRRIGQNRWQNWSVAALSLLIMGGIAEVFSSAATAWLSLSLWDLSPVLGYLMGLYTSHEALLQEGWALTAGLLLFWVVHRYGDTQKGNEKELIPR